MWVKVQVVAPVYCTTYQTERLASEPFGRGRCWRWARPSASTFLSRVSAEGASCQRPRRLVRSPEADIQPA